MIGTSIHYIVATSLTEVLRVPVGVKLVSRPSDVTNNNMVVEARDTDGGCILVCGDRCLLFAAYLTPLAVATNTMTIDYGDPDLFDRLQNEINERYLLWDHGRNGTKLCQ